MSKRTGPKKVPKSRRSAPVGVSLRPYHVRTAKLIGKGGISEGVQKALEYAQRELKRPGSGVHIFQED
mgnify:CR=1 FL=1